MYCISEFGLYFKLKSRPCHTFIISELKVFLKTKPPSPAWPCLSGPVHSAADPVGCCTFLQAFLWGTPFCCCRLDPQLKQLQIKYDELKERRASLRNAACFLSSLTQLHQDYSDIQEKEPYVKETVTLIFISVIQKIQGICTVEAFCRSWGCRGEKWGRNITVHPTSVPVNP